MKRVFSSIFSITLIVVLIGAIMLRQDIRDWSRLRGYTPPVEIAALADNTTMLDNSRRLFYVQHPVLADKATFNEHCRENEHTIVLGCYIHGRGIFLLDVDDERLSGIKEVTAAHELLHAAYERLSSKERSRVDRLLQQAYDNLDNERLRQTIELYRRQDPNVVPNELHSILGTEVRTLPAELEEHYARYFSDRLAVVTYSERYERVFLERRNQVRIYDEQLKSLKSHIESLQASLDSQRISLDSQRSQMNSYRSSGQTQAYNEQVPIYNQKVNAYNRDIERLEALIIEHNDIVQRRNDVVSEEAELVEAIDSRDVVPQQR